MPNAMKWYDFGHILFRKNTKEVIKFGETMKDQMALFHKNLPIFKNFLTFALQLKNGGVVPIVIGIG